MRGLGPLSSIREREESRELGCLPASLPKSLYRKSEHNQVVGLLVDCPIQKGPPPGRHFRAHWPASSRSKEPIDLLFDRGLISGKDHEFGAAVLMEVGNIGANVAAG